MLFRAVVAAAVLWVAAAGSGSAGDAPWKPEVVTKIPGLSDAIYNNANGRVLLVGPERLFRLSLVRGRTMLSPLRETRLPAPPADAIPDSRLTTGTGSVAMAWLSEPTARYDHAVLGDRIEAEAVKVRLKSGRVLSYRLPEDSVFEDLEARIVALDDQEAVLVVRSYLDRGAAIALYGVERGKLQPLAESQPIGSPHRWLNPIGAADFTGDGKVEIAAVVTPHLSGRLTLYRRFGPLLPRIAERGGYSTHFIGSTVLAMRALADINGDGVVDIVLPSLDRRNLAAVTFAGGEGRELRSVSHDWPIVTSIVMADVDKKGAPDLVYGLENGAVMLIRR